MTPVDEDEFTYQALVNRWKKERSTSAPTRMDGTFYDGLDRTLRELRDAYAKEHAANPATPKVLILQDELVNLQRVRDDIYDLRERKIVTTAIIAARGGNPDRTNLTREEDVLFEEILRVLRDARRNLLRRGQPTGAYDADEAARRRASDGPRAAAGPPTPPEPAPAPAAPAQPAAVLADRAPAAEAAPETPLPGAPAVVAPVAKPPEEVVAHDEARERRTLGPARVLVRMRQAVAPFVGTDLRTYRLAAEDVAAVPKEIAHALVTRGLAVALSG